jgi:hypothetical protein
MLLKKLKISILALGMVAGCHLYGQKVVLPSGLLSFQSPASGSPDASFLQKISFDGHFFFAAYFSQIPDETVLKNLQKEGSFLKEKLAPATYLIQTKSFPDARWCQSMRIIGIAALSPSLKMDVRIATNQIPSFAIATKDVIKVMVGTYGNRSFQKIADELRNAGFTSTSFNKNTSGIFKGTIAISSLTSLASLPFVYAVRLQNPEDKVLNEIARPSAGASLLQAPIASGGRNLTGKGVTIGVGDDADPTLHPDIRDRIINHTPGITNNHGSHVAGTVGGAGILTYRTAGFAPQANILSQWFSGVWKNAGIYTEAYDMAVTNNSYGSIAGDCIYAGVYDLSSRELDENTLAYPQLLHAFASGNDGDITCAPFPRAYHTVLGGYQSAKNIITVGRTDYTQVSSSSSSSGPVRDGRLKPEITGLGIITSLNGTGDGYFTDYGTSMSSPNIAGGLGLLYERYRQLKSGVNPPGALMKAILLNGARDVGLPGPDFRHGYGTMMLERSLRILENNNYSVRNLTQGAIQDTIINVPAGTKQLKVMAYWHDPAANVLAAKTLVHDLDLEVIAPGGLTVFPKILNPLAEGVNQPATEGEDHTNNHEQVVIDNPVPGNYTIRVKGTEIATLPSQPYAITFDFVPVELRFTNPVRDTKAAAGTLIFSIAWEDETGVPGDYTLAYSTDDGNTWTDIIAGLKDTTRLYFWQPGNIRTIEARLRITKGSTVTISEKFAIIPNLSFSAAAANDQCNGLFRINWTPLTALPGETISYLIKLKQGAAMQTIAEVSNINTFTIPNLHPDSTYYAAIVAGINGVEGVYNTAISRRPNTGNCAGSISDGDLRLDSIIAPLSGRQFTSTALQANTQVAIRIRNLDNAPTSSFAVKYNINGGAYTEATINTPLAALGTTVYTFPAADFSGTGSYQVTAIVENIGAVDVNAINDTFRLTVQHLPNASVSLASPLTEDFETADAISALRSQTGLANLARWDYLNADPLARARTFVTPGLARSGNRAVTLDVSKSAPRVINPFNQLIGTYNLSNYNVNDHEARLNFFFKHHGIMQGPHPQNKVWVRGSDTDNWVELFDLGNAQTDTPGDWKGITAISLNDSLKKAGQSFSASTQLRFGQFAFFSMADNENFGGYTFDDITVLLAENDVQLLDIENPAAHLCGATSEVTVKIKLRNGTPATLTNIPVRYRINGDSWVSEQVATLAGKSEIEYTFASSATLPGFGKFTIEAEVLQTGDNIPGNNTQQISFINQPVVSTFPYYEDFETGTNGFVAEGLNSTWAWGKPASLRINSAASGDYAWKTRLTGDYNNREKSYLYSPCFDISTLTVPMLSFSFAYAFEDCRNFNAICDAGWMEYSLDGNGWQKLGSFGEGESWYDYEPGQVWMRNNQTNWREAIIALPKHNGTIRLRFVLNSDDGSTREGMAIDNFHVYNGGALPLEWLSFSAALNAVETVDLRWITGKVNPGESFDIQVTALTGDESSFRNIGRVDITTDERRTFTFYHQPNTKSSYLFYRIIWNKGNGEKSISPVRKIQFPARVNELLVFPNPADNQLQVQANLGTDEKVSLRIFSMDGKILYQQQVNTVNGWLSTFIDLSPMKLTTGMYFLEITGAKNRQVRKWIKR